MFAREVKLLKSKSFFLFGARGTGKSTLLKEFFKDDKTYWIDLLDESLLQRYLAYPLEFEQTILGLKDYKNTWIVVDEVQKAPALLNYVHRLIEQHKIKFALTGSSARKLKRGGANLLAGRATSNSLHPLTHLELGLSFDLDYALNWGSLPQTFSEDEEGRKDFLRSYATTYVKEEIKEEQVVRKIEPFLHFLEVAAQCNGNVLNFSKIGRDSGNSPSNVERYYEILKDTLLGFELQPYHESLRKRQSQRSKFYLFDLGVKKAIDRTLNVPTTESTYAYGKAFEHFFIIECIRLNDYLKKDFRFSYLLTKDNVEVDLIIERPGQRELWIEIKSAKRVDENELGHVLKLKAEKKKCDLIIASRETQTRQLKDFKIMPWQDAIHEIFN